MYDIFTDTLRWMVLILSILDSWKYRYIAQKVSRLKSSREISRKFINISIMYRIFLLLYSWLILGDWVITVSCLLAIYTLAEAFHYVYLFYPYKNRGLRNFKRPGIIKYILNSAIPNKWAKRL